MTMTSTVSALRQRMIEDMAARTLGPHSQRSHIHSCRRFAAFLKRSPDTASADDIRRFQLYLVESGLSISNRNRIMTGVKFLLAVPCLFLVESFPEGAPLLEWCGNCGLEGIVSKRLSSSYSSGVCHSWRKVKCDGWREANQFRHKLFEGPRKQEPDPRVRQLKKREELARVVARLQDPDVRPGM